MSIFVKTDIKTYCFKNELNAVDIKNKIMELQGMPSQMQNLYYNSKLITNQLCEFQNNQTIYLRLNLVGGKGGFGAKLKNQGSKKVRSNNNHSRDLSGRRIENINLQKSYIDFCKKKKFQDEQVQQQRKKFKTLSNTLFQDYAFMRLDKKYKQQLQSGQRNIQQAIKMGLKNVRQNAQKNISSIEKNVNQDIQINNQKQQENQEKVEQNQQKLELKLTQKDSRSQQVNNEQKIQITQADNQPENKKQQPEIIQEIKKDEPSIIQTTKEITEVKDLKRPRTVESQIEINNEQDKLTKKLHAQKNIQSIMRQDLEINVNNLKGAAAKLKSLFKKK